MQLHEPLFVEWEKSRSRKAGRGRVVGYVTYRRKVQAVVLIRDDLIHIPLGEVKVRPPKKR